MSNCDDTTEVIQEDRMKSFTITALAVLITPCAVSGQRVVTGQAVFADYSQQQPGIYRKITVADLPEPKPGESVDNGAKVVARPEAYCRLRRWDLKCHCMPEEMAARHRLQMDISPSGSGMPHLRAHFSSQGSFGQLQMVTSFFRIRLLARSSCCAASGQTVRHRLFRSTQRG